MSKSDETLKQMMARNRFLQLQNERRNQALDKELELGKQKTDRESKLFDLFPKLLEGGVKAGEAGLKAYEGIQDKAKAQAVEESLVAPVSDKKRFEAIGEGVAALEIDSPLSPEERADKIIADKKSAYKKNPWSTETLNEDSLKKIRPKLILSIKAKDQELADKAIAQDKARSEAKKVEAEIGKVKADTQGKQVETQGKEIELDFIAPKAEAELFAKKASADKDYSEIQKTKLEGIAKSINKLDIKSVLGIKDPAEQDKAFQEMSDSLAEATGENPKLVKGVIGSAAFSIADDSQKEQLKQSNWSKEQGFRWAQLAENRKERELRSQEREDIRADKKAISTEDRELLYQRKSALEDAKSLQSLVKEAGADTVVGVGSALATGLKNSLKNPAISVEEGVSAAMNELGRDDVGKAIMRKTLQLVQRVGKSREGGRMTDADLRFYLQNLINTGTASPQDFSNSIDEMVADTKKGYSTQRNTLKNAGKTALDEFPDIEIEVGKPSYEIQLEKRKEDSRKENKTFEERNDALSSLDPSTGVRISSLVDKYVGDDPKKETAVLKALANAQKQGKGLDAKYLLESGNIKEILKQFGSAPTGALDGILSK